MELIAESYQEKKLVVRHIPIYIMTSLYPEDSTETKMRIIRKKTKLFIGKNGGLFYKHRCKGKVINENMLSIVYGYSLFLICYLTGINFPSLCAAQQRNRKYFTGLSD